MHALNNILILGDDNIARFIGKLTIGDGVSRSRLTRGSLRLTGLALAGLLTASLGLSGGASAASTPAYPKLFDTSEKRSLNLKPFPKWTGALDRYFKDAGLPEGSCDDAAFNKCHLAYWGDFIDKLADVPPLEQLDSINRYMNEAPYITDPRNYSVKDYWATPKQFFDRDGDCEDYAIAKFTSLRALGWDNTHMRIVVLQDLNLKIAHAVLVVYVDGEAWILDNQIKQIVTADTIRHYRPLFSLNEDSWWIHRR